jgi:hypothetical protein
MSNACEFGVLPGHLLVMLEDLLKHVYVPLIEPEPVAHERVKGIHTVAMSHVSGSLSHASHPHHPHGATASSSGGQHSAHGPGHSAESIAGASAAGGASGAGGSAFRGVEESADNMLSAELSAAMAKFIQQISHTIHQVTGTVQLRIPTDLMLEHAESADEDEHQTLLGQLEDVLQEWIKVIQNVLDGEQKKEPLDQTPLAEINFWRERHATLSPLYEQLVCVPMRAMEGG